MALVFEGGIEVNEFAELKGAAIRASARVASTADVNVAASIVGATIDGISVVADDVVLLKNQTTASQNGVYLAVTAAAPRRVYGLDTDDFASGLIIFVQDGTTNASTAWICTNASGSDVIDTDNLTFARFDVHDTLDITRGGTGSTSFTGNGVVVANGAGTALTSVTPVNNAVLVTDGSGVPSLSTTLPTVTLGANTTVAGTPTNPNDVVTVSYVQGLVQGLDVKDSVRVGTTVDVLTLGTGGSYNNTGGTSGRGQLTWTTGPTTIDGITLADGDRILIKDQVNGDENGIWVRTSANTWDRATDFDEDAEVTAAAFTFIEEGSVNADSGWVLTTDDPITIGGASGTSLAWSQFSAAGMVNAGDGLTKSGNTINLGNNGTGTFDGLTIGADTIAVALKTNGGIVLESDELALDLGATAITGTLAVGDGGTGVTTFGGVNTILYTTAADTLASVAAGTDGQILTSVSGVPTFTDANALATRIGYSILSIRARANSSTPSNIAYFAWKVTGTPSNNEYPDPPYSSAKIVYEVEHLGRDLTIEVYDETAAASLGSDTATASGFRAFTITLPVANARLAFRISRNNPAGADANPFIYGIQMEINA